MNRIQEGTVPTRSFPMARARETGRRRGKGKRVRVGDRKRETEKWGGREMGREGEREMGGGKICERRKRRRGKRGMEE